MIACLTPGCPRMPRTRGLCPLHYQRLVLAIKAGTTTYAAEEAAGRLKPAKRGDTVFPRKAQ